MKKSIFSFAAIFAIGSTAFAQITQPAPQPTSKEVMSCEVANAGGETQVTLSMTVMYDAAADYMILNIVDKGVPFRMFAQMEKGKVEASLANGSLVSVLFEENLQQDAGVVRNAGIVVFQAASAGGYGGLLSARGNLYPLTCKGI